MKPLLRLMLLLLALPGQLVSQVLSDEHSGAPTVHATRLSAALVIDGVADEPAWVVAEPITVFTQLDPEEGRPASEPTELRVLYDADAIYFSARLSDSRAPSSRLARRDTYLSDSDWLSISLDTHHDHLTAYRFSVNPAGVKIDEVLSANGEDSTWDPVWSAETAVTDRGWSVEMRIPFSQLRFSDEEVQVWGIQIGREIARRQENSIFAFTPKRERGGIPRYGHLRGLQGLDRGYGVELMPYVATRGEFEQGVPGDAALFPDPYRDGSELSPSAGLDVKVRLASNLTLDATVNPDFGQVEVDPAVVNLTQYETRFEEKRPFFTEGASIFQFGEDLELLYSRRIGGAPSWDAPEEAIHQTVPTAATILGAAKLTGRSEGWSVGFIDAVTADEVARYVDAAGDEHTSAAAPLTNFAAARVQRSFLADRSTFGFLATTVHRSLEQGLTEQLPSSAYAGGIDFRHQWANNAWSLTGHLAGSRVEGSRQAIGRLQTSSARYFQRPDAKHVSFDPAATTLAGYAATARLTKHAGLHWRGRAILAATSPGFEVNDAGFQRTADRINSHVRLQYVEERPGPALRQWSVSGGPDTGWNYDRDHLGTSLSFEANAQLHSYWQGEIRADRFVAGIDDRLTRGGPITRGVGSSRIYASIDSDDRKRWVFSTEVDYLWDEAGGSVAEVAVGVNLRPAERWRVSLQPQLSRNLSTAHFVGSIADPLAEPTFGRRYLFADLDETRLALEMRLDLTFRPGLTLELYAQPFVAAAQFGSFKELRAPRTFSFLTYGTDAGTVDRDGRTLLIDPDGTGPASGFQVVDEDFTTRSLRGNAVLRWEWRPGSTLFLVWQQTRQGLDPAGEFDLPRDLRAVFTAEPTNVILLKVSYWFSR